MEDAFDFDVRKSDEGDMVEVWEDGRGPFIVAALQRDIGEKLEVRLQHEASLSCSEFRVDGSLDSPIAKGGKSVCVGKHIGYIAPDGGDAYYAMLIWATVFTSGKYKPPACVQGPKELTQIRVCEEPDGFPRSVGR